jgi:hypothetical protein
MQHKSSLSTLERFEDIALSPIIQIHSLES